VNRAFSADFFGFSAPRALPQARSEDRAVGAKHILNESAYASAIVAPRKDLAMQTAPASQNCFASQAGVRLS
jgi:hypothetical protein